MGLRSITSFLLKFALILANPIINIQFTIRNSDAFGYSAEVIATQRCCYEKQQLV